VRSYLSASSGLDDNRLDLVVGGSVSDPSGQGGAIGLGDARRDQEAARCWARVATLVTLLESVIRGLGCGVGSRHGDGEGLGAAHGDSRGIVC
jgi:hypothetical protein